MAENKIVVTEQDTQDKSLLLRLLRKFSDSDAEIKQRLGKVERAPLPPTYPQIRDQLQANGGAPLNLSALPGVAGQPQLAMTLRSSSAPTGPILQQLRDAQLFLVGTTSTGFSLQTVVGGNPNNLYQLIGSLTTSSIGSTSTNLMTLDTVQTSTGAKTLTGVWTHNAALIVNADITAGANILSSGTITRYHGLVTTAEGVPYIVSRDAQVNKTSSVANTTLFTTTATGEYRFSYFIECIATGTSLPVLQYSYTNDAAARGVSSTGLALSLLGLEETRTLFLRSASGAAFQYNVSFTTATSTSPAGTYSVFVMLERLS